MVRIDMGEYMEKHSVARLIGAPPGYVGYDEGGQLSPRRCAGGRTAWCCSTRSRRPTMMFSTCYSRYWMTADLTDGQGRTVDFTNVVLVMTSNLPGDPLGFFKPEFINRVDDIVRFRPLTQADLGRIVSIQLGRLRQRLADRRITLVVTPAAEAKLAADGYDPAFGARPLKRVIQREVGDRLASAILEGRFVDGDTVTVDVTDGALTAI